MKIEIIEKIKVTEAELLEVQSVNDNRRRLSEEIHRADKPHTKAIFDSATGEVTEEYI